MKGKSHHVCAPLAGTVWKIVTVAGQSVTEGETLLILESMKMEVPVEADRDGTLVEIHVKEGSPVNEGTPVVTLTLG